METTLSSLKDGVDALLMSGLWRSAGLSFLRAVHDDWTHAALARWLMGPYHQATSFVPRSEAPAQEVPSVDRPRIAEIMRSSREEVVAALRDLASGGDPTFREGRHPIARHRPVPRRILSPARAPERRLDERSCRHNLSGCREDCRPLPLRRGLPCLVFPARTASAHAREEE
jgi:hypothetical protein